MHDPGKMPVVTNSERVKMIWGLSLHSWEDAMRFSLAVIGIFGLIVGLSTWFVVKLQRAEIEQSRKEFEAYKLESSEKITESTTRQKEAELKLEQLRRLSGPRDINLHVFQKELVGKPKAPVMIWYLPDSSDGYLLASQLFVALKQSEWEVAWPAPIPELDEKGLGSSELIAILRDMPRAIKAGGQPAGVSVVTDDLNAGVRDNTSYGALFDAISKSTSFGVFGSAGSQLMPVPKGTLRVVIAAKSEPTFLDANPPDGVQK